MRQPRGAQVIDLKGATLLPGIIDAHVHNAYALDRLETWAHSGVTTVCDMGAPLTVPFGLERELASPYPGFARLVTAGPIVTVPEGYPIAINHFPSLAVTSPMDAQVKTGYLLDQGAAVIKTALESSAGHALTVEELRAVVQAAHAAGKRVHVHQTTPGDLATALQSGADVMDHMVVEGVSDATLQEMVRAGVYWVPTLEVIRHFYGDGAGTLQRFVALGGQVALGTDAGYYPYLPVGMPLYEMERLQQAGMSPMQVIVAATAGSAYVCGLEEQVGTIAHDRQADLLVVAGDPLQDLHALEKPLMVIHNGVIIVDRRGN